MLINSEKELEDYICQNQERFINSLKKTINTDEDIKFIGRQVEIGQENRSDLMYYYDHIDKENNLAFRFIIIVELKFRKLEPRDISQLSRYMNIFQECINNDKIKNKNINDIFVEGVFVSMGQDELTKEISMFLNQSSSGNDIYFMNISSQINFNEESYSYNEEYIKNLKLDKRINDLFE